MSKTKIVLNVRGLWDLLRSPEIQSTVEGHAQVIAGRTGGTTETYVAQTRAVAEVHGDDGQNGLLKAMR